MSNEDVLAASSLTNSEFNKRELLIKFIHSYRDKPFLWNTTLKSYFDRTKKPDAYLSLLEDYKQLESNATVEDVKKKINTLRTNYRKELRRVHHAMTTGMPVSTSWKFNELSFLGNNYERLNNSASDEETTASNKRIISKVEPLHWEVEYENECPTFWNDSTPTRSAMEEREMKKRKLTNSSPQTIDVRNHVAVESEENVMVRNWTFKLARLQPEQRIWAEKFINDILTEGELGTLHRHFMTSSNPQDNS